ncbi:MAG: glutathione S-transferase N-terminal domain-containing protein [Synergistaceae bacterium]|jgi:glutaredoxin-like YruB-family protein|nr:glutathione S-transferase N-terminal domain-containing protein [Synergistaceae bacterium]
MSEETKGAGVAVYSTSSCPWCVKAKEYLSSLGVPFQAIDVGVDRDAAKEIVEKTRQRGVPVIRVGERYIVGFDQDAIKSALKEAALI